LKIENECREDSLQNAKQCLPDCFCLCKSCCLNVGENRVLPLVTVEIIFKNKLYKFRKTIVKSVRFNPKHLLYKIHIYKYLQKNGLFILAVQPKQTVALRLTV